MHNKKGAFHGALLDDLDEEMKQFEEEDKGKNQEENQEKHEEPEQPTENQQNTNTQQVDAEASNEPEPVLPYKTCRRNQKIKRTK